MKYYLIVLLLIITTHCKTTEVNDGPPAQPLDLSTIHDAIPKEEPRSLYGNPPFYEVLGHRYYVLPSSENYHQQGTASWYGTKFNGQLTSTREPYDMLAMTAASPVLPLPSYVKVTNLANHRQVVVRVNDRGPFHEGRILDLSYAAASKLDMLKKGTAFVQVDAITLNSDDLSDLYYLQIAAFNDCQYAESLVKRLALMGEVHVVPDPNNNQAIACRVQIGPLKDKQTADDLKLKLTEAGFINTFMVKA